MRKNLILVFLALFTTTMFSQTLETVLWGNSKELQKNTSFQKIIGTSNDGFYAVRSDDPSFVTRDKMWLDYISFATLDVDESNEIVFPNILSKQTYYNDMFFVNDKLILFSSMDDAGRAQRVLYMSYLNNNGTVKNMPKEVGVVPNSNLKEDGFKFIYLESTKEIMLYFHKTYSGYNGEKFSIKIFDSNLKAVFDEELVFPDKFMGKKNKLVQIEKGESGNIYMLFKVEIVDSKGKKTETSDSKFENVLLVYNVAKKEFKSYDVGMTKFVANDVKFSLTKDEMVFLAGTFAPKSSKTPNEFSGMFYTQINPKTEKEIIPANIKNTFYDISRDKELLATFKSERSGETPNDKYSFKVRSIEKLVNGGFVVVAEQYFDSYREFKDPETKEMVKITYNNYNDLLIGGIDKNGVFNWIKRFPKEQYSIEDGGYYSSFATLTNENTVRLIYNDDEKNIKNTDPMKTKPIKFNPKTTPSGTAIIHSVYTDGSIQKTPMFGDKDANCVIVPRVFNTSKDGYLIYTQIGKKYRFAQFVVE